MSIRSLALGLGLVFTTVAVADQGSPAAAAGKKGHHPIHGHVVAVVKDGDKDAGTITIKAHHKKGQPKGSGAEHTVRVTSATKFEVVKGSKNGKSSTPSSFAAVHKGEHVVVHHNGKEATDVKIVEKSK